MCMLGIEQAVPHENQLTDNSIDLAFSSPVPAAEALGGANSHAIVQRTLCVAKTTACKIVRQSAAMLKLLAIDRFRLLFFFEIVQIR